jgi:homoserine dehydrogenase
MTRRLGVALLGRGVLGGAVARPLTELRGHLAELALPSRVRAADVPGEDRRRDRRRHRERPADGLPVTPLLLAEPGPDGGRGVRVRPAMPPQQHPFVGVGDAFDAVFGQADAAGPLSFSGRGAGAGHGDDATLVPVSHTATGAALAATVAGLGRLDALRAVASSLRVQGGK